MINLGPLEVIVIFVVALLVFGPTKLPEIGRSVGKAVREFRKFQSSFQNSFQDELKGVLDEPAPKHPMAGTLPQDSAPVREAGNGDSSPDGTETKPEEPGGAADHVPGRQTATPPVVANPPGAWALGKPPNVEPAPKPSPAEPSEGTEPPVSR